MNMMKSNQAASTSSFAYATIRDRIINLTLKPGEKISEKELADEFSISRTPIREAMIRLQYDGFVDILAQRGTYVTPIKKDTVMAAHYARSTLECALIQDAAKACTEQHINDLKHNLEEQEAACRRKTYLDIERLDEEMHAKIAEAAGYSAVWDVIYPVRLHINRVRMLFLEEQRIPFIISEHANLIRALEARDPAQALHAMQTHLSYIETNLAKLAEAYSEYLNS
jgi:DNA-binding GntR family transcriptional regulator